MYNLVCPLNNPFVTLSQYNQGICTQLQHKHLVGFFISYLWPQLVELKSRTKWTHGISGYRVDQKSDTIEEKKCCNLKSFLVPISHNLWLLYSQLAASALQTQTPGVIDQFEIFLVLIKRCFRS